MTLHLQTGAENETLRKVSKRIPAVTGELRSYALDMIKSMESENGVGLAAPQAGRNIRMIVCKLNPGEKNEVIIPMLNPSLLQVSEEMEEGEEGCLSLPGVWGIVPRHVSILIRYTNLKGHEQTLEFSDFNARILQHEIDHLDGILFIDRATKIKKGKNHGEGMHI